MSSKNAVLTEKQERQSGAASTNIWYTSGNSGRDLWKLKANHPERFKKEKPGFAEPVPPGFEQTEKRGWYYNRADKIFFVSSSKKFLWFDEEKGEHKDLYEGQDRDLSFSAGAVSLAEGSKTAPKTVVIPELHRVAAAMKVDLAHVDKPAAMLGVFANEMTARSFHEKLVRRLSLNRSRWLDTDVVSALESVVLDVAGGAMSVVVVLGQRACGCATQGAAFCLSLRTPWAGCVNSIGGTKPGHARLLALKDGDTLYTAALLGPPNVLEEDFETMLAPQVAKRWHRTGSISFLRSLRSRGIKEPLALGCARLLPDLLWDRSEAKRLKASNNAIFAVGSSSSSRGGNDQVRLRQILLRVAGSGPAIMDPIRRKQVKRSQEEAEAEMLAILQSLEADGMKSFQKVCREVSECPSALKGGELAGDMGWLDRVKGVGIQQDKAKQGVRPDVPGAVLKAAFQLEVGEVHDLVSTDVGVHLLQRTA